MLNVELNLITKLVINGLLGALGVQFDASSVKRLSGIFECCVQCSWFRASLASCAGFTRK
ncbi:MAG: hypothetical protein RQ842_06670 [Vulcanisaeta sp.]|nr:hypothetical protein [Vulcanisaeta sp.]